MKLLEARSNTNTTKSTFLHSWKHLNLLNQPCQLLCKYLQWVHLIYFIQCQQNSYFDSSRVTDVNIFLLQVIFNRCLKRVVSDHLEKVKLIIWLTKLFHTNHFAFPTLPAFRDDSCWYHTLNYMYKKLQFASPYRRPVRWHPKASIKGRGYFLRGKSTTFDLLPSSDTSAL